jgi:hypothetical protein
LAPSLGPAGSQLIGQLAGLRIRTLEDVRRAGGVAKLASASDTATARLIDIHADLARLSSDVTGNAALIAKGYDGSLAIARTPRAVFLMAAAPVVGELAATGLHIRATAMYSALDQLLTGLRVDAANGIPAGLPSSPNGEDGQPCQCCSCQAAPSPAAYLADLLAYIVQHLLNRRQRITLQFLVDRFHQPFADLPTDCEAVTRQVREVRLCVEVLRSYLAAHPPTPDQLAALQSAQAAYLDAAYSALLAGIGTSYEEIRLARHADWSTRSALASRLGLKIDPFGSGRPDHLDALLFDPTVAPPAPQALTEAALERMFGLADTKRNPLSDGTTLNDAGQQITRWNLTGVEWGKNTNSDGTIFVSLTRVWRTATDSDFKVELYKNAARTQLVGFGYLSIGGDNVAVSIDVFEQNFSGLSGHFEIATPIDNTTIELGAVPLLTSWQLDALRAAWLAEDHPADPYTEGVTVSDLAILPASVIFPPPLQGKIRYDPAAHVLIFTGVMAPADLVLLIALSPDTQYRSAVKTLYVQSQRQPVIDPDVIGPDDFRVPVPKAKPSDPDQPYDIWLRRRAWVDTRLRDLALKTKVVKGKKVPDIECMFALMYLPLTYGTTTTPPWDSAVKPSTFETLWENLAEGVEVDATRLQLAADLGLTIDAFNRLMYIRHQDEAAVIDPRKPAVAETEWREVYSILAEAAKTRFFSGWRNEESALPLVFGSQTFVVSLREPAVGDWPPVDGQPLIDPARVTLTDLPDSVVGTRAVAFWHARSAKESQVTQDLRTTRETAGLAAALSLALARNPGDPLPDDLDLLARQLLDPDPAVVAAASAKVQSDLCMTVDAFNRLMAIRAMDANSNPLLKPTAGDWIDLYGILTAAETKKRLYPAWRTEESNPTTGVVYWTAHKALLPLWRSNAQLRSQWHAALARRTAPPIIDPDLIDQADLANLFLTANDPAWALWYARNFWVRSLLGGPAPVDLAAVDAALLSALGVAGTDLMGIATQRDAGADIMPRLAQLSLSGAAFDQLVGIRKLVADGVVVLVSEWDGFWSILAQVRKQRRFAIWQKEEADQHIVLGPDEFQRRLPATAGPSCTGQEATLAGPPPVLPAWRATLEARQVWDDTLNARIQQQDTVISAGLDVVDASENATLTQLRDALIMATDAPGSDLASKADWFTANLMIDAKAGGCQKTTRIEQAIETLQTVMNGIRDGQIGDLDVQVTSAPAAISFVGAGRFDVFVRGEDGAVWHKWWQDLWHDWESLGGNTTSATAPAVASQGYGTMDLFVRGADSALWHLGYDGNWSAWESLGGVLASGPTAVSQGPGVVDVYVVGTDGAIWNISGGTGNWGPWVPVTIYGTQPFEITSTPAAALTYEKVPYLFVRGSDNSLWYAFYAGVWYGWFSLGGYLTSDPVAVAASAGTLDVFVRGGDFAIWRLSFQLGSGWGPWTSIGGFALEGPGVSTWGSGRLDVFIGGGDSALWHKWWDGTWHDWEAFDELTLDTPQFDEEWKWMGSYATWRAAILVFIYPEDILDPTLRKWQTPEFRKLVADIRANPSLTPQQARDEACQYSNYYRDVCSLKVETSCWAFSRPDVGCRAAANTAGGFLLHMFGRALPSNTAYWSTYRYGDTSPYAQTFWDVVPGLGGQNLISLVGSTLFWIWVTGGPLDQQRVFLFFISADPGGLKLRFTRYNPDIRAQNGWENQIYELPLPTVWSSFTARLVSQSSDYYPPLIAVTLPDSSTYERALNASGTGWSDVDWVRLGGAWTPWTRALDANVGDMTVVATNADRLDLFWIDGNGFVQTTSSDVNVNGGNLSPPSRIDNGFTGRSGSARVAAVARKPNHLDIFVTDKDGTVYWNWWDANEDNGLWHTFRPISQVGFSKADRQLAAVAKKPHDLDLFIVGTDGRIWSRFGAANSGDVNWYDWYVIGDFNDPTSQTNLTSVGVAAVARGSGHLDVFMVANDGILRHNSWDANSPGWSFFWESIHTQGVQVTDSSILRAVSRSPTRVDVFIGGKPQTGQGQQVLWNWSDFNRDSGAWHSLVPIQPQPVEGWPNRPIAAVGRTGTHLDVFVAGSLPLPSAIFSSWQDDNVDGGAWHPWSILGDINGQNVSALAAVSRIPQRIDVFLSSGAAIYRAFWQESDVPSPAVTLPPFPPTPNVTAPLDIPDHLESKELQNRRTAIKVAFENNSVGPASNLTYLEEAYYFVPVYLARQSQRQGQYSAALDWFRTIYDYSVPPSLRNIYYGFELEKCLPAVGQRLWDWLLDPLNPHLIAVTRQYAYARYTILAIVQCLLDYADARFTYDTAESDAQARTLYMTALDLLALPIFEQSTDPCEGILIVLESIGKIPNWSGVLGALLGQLARINRTSVLASVVPQIQEVLAGNTPLPERFSAARALVSEAKRKLAVPLTVGEVLARRQSNSEADYAVLLANPTIEPLATGAAVAAGSAFDSFEAGLPSDPMKARTSVTSKPVQTAGGGGSSDAPRSQVSAAVLDRIPAPNLPHASPLMGPQPGVGRTTRVMSAPSYIPNGSIAVPRVTFWFCIPPNPLLDTLRSHAELNLYKLRNCMNIAGMRRQVDPYSAPTDVASGLPTIGAGGQLLVPGTVVIQPTQYGYSALIERAKQLVQVAAQMEAAMLAALEKRDQGTYEELQARQSLAVATATVQLQDLAVRQATDGVTLAQLQQQRAQIQTDHWQQMLQSDVGDLEQSAIDAMQEEADLQIASAAAHGASASASAFLGWGWLTGSTESALASSLSSLASSYGTFASTYSARAALELQQSDWQFQYSLGVEDGRIAAQQVVSAQDQVRIAAQERNIAQLQADQKAAIVDFLANKFTNADLYDWMSTVLQGVYSYFLRQAAVVARLAENQMAFERQEVPPPGFIKADYWQPPASGTSSGSAGGGSNTLGLTGSARLTQDIYELDQYHFLTEKRKLQLTKTISLAQRFPVEFQGLRDTGVMRFVTRLMDFDRDFPGHYLRLIQKVSTSVIALIPPTQGIKATLSTTAATRVVIGPEVFQTTIVRRDPQSVALTSPTNATGVFAMDPQSNLLFPFQGLGVEAQWEFSMPKGSNQFDYSTLADVLISIDYTALNSPDYRAQVLPTLGDGISAERPFSFRNDLADQWYDLNNPDQTATPMTVQFTTSRGDFPPNLSDFRIEQVLLYFSRANGATFEVSVKALQFAEGASTSTIGGAATSINGVISTRRGNASSWILMIGKTPFGNWQLSLPNAEVMRNRIANGDIQDILFVITYSAQTGGWPQ